MCFAVILGLAALGRYGVTPLSASSMGQPEFDRPETLELIARARALRELPASERPELSYHAQAEGHIYFFLDPDAGGEPVPMRVDQVALDFFRGPRGQTRQVVAATRKQELLPVRDFRYYLDRLTAIQNGFGDRIEIGEGLDVRGILHPLAQGGDELYRYRIVDSVTVSVHTMATPIQVYEVAVRPRRDDVPAFWGSVFLEARTGALARMAFTFTPASYVDPRSDQIHVQLEHGLWDGVFWLPYRQVVEVRREVPRLDLPVGSVIRAILQVTDYNFDTLIEPSFFEGPRVTLPPNGGGDSTRFRTGLLDGMAAQGLSPANLADVQAQARRWARDRVVSGLPRLRLHARQASSVLRVNRAEGIAMGIGASYAAGSSLRLDGVAGWGTNSRWLHVGARGRWSSSGGETTLEFFRRQLRDSGPHPGAAGLVNSLATALRSTDYTDPHFASGARISVERFLDERTGVSLAASWERHAGPPLSPWSTGLGSTTPTRRLRPVQEGALARLHVGARRQWGGMGAWGGNVEVWASGGRWRGEAHATIAMTLGGRAASADLARQARLTLEGGVSGGAVPHQLLFLLGGRNTLPGHRYRSYGGRRYLLAQAEATQALVQGWLTARFGAGAGATGSLSAAARKGWGLATTEGVAGYVALGIATFHDIVRVDGAWGLPGGALEIVLSVDPRWSPFL